MKNYILVTLLMTGFLGGAFGQDSLTTNPPKRKSLAILYGSSDLWYQNYLSRRDYLQTYTHFGLQYDVEVKKNVDVYATLIYGSKDVKKVASAGLGLRYYLLDRETHDKFRPFANFSGEVMMDNSTPTTFSDVDFTGSIGTGFDFKIVGSLYGRAMVNVGFPFFQIGQVDFTDGRGTYTHYTAGIVYEWGRKSKSSSSTKKEVLGNKAPSVMKSPPAMKTTVVDKSTTTEIATNVEKSTTIERPAITEVAAAVTSPATLKAAEPPVMVDSDGDGVADKDDKCPTVVGVNVNKGCPADSDGDGVIDAEDLMPNIVGLAAFQGVPENLVIYFDTDKFDLTAESMVTADVMVKLFSIQPSLKLKLTGHTDSRQSVQYNVTLSKNRVFETRKYLIKNGVDAKRMKLSWFSELVPAAPNKTVDGMKLNRRVELRIVK
jgi:outer membrane protein OmpA-like peptidoglycan-associated protein